LWAEEVLLRAVKLRKSGSNFHVYIPRRVLEKFNLKSGDEFVICPKPDGTIVFKPAKSKPKLLCISIPWEIVNNCGLTGNEEFRLCARPDGTLLLRPTKPLR